MKASSTPIKPRFTVIIPTKNRADYLFHTLRTCSIQNYEPLDIIVSDDESVDHTHDVVSQAARLDPRIRYTKPDRGRGMRENFEHALRQAKSGYVIALGGDDGLLPNGIDGMREALEAFGTPLLTWPAPVYVYPGVRGSRGQLILHRRRGSKTIDSEGFLRRQAGTLHYLSDLECPMLYVKGVASTALVDRVRGRSPNGRFYSCPTPDGYSGLALAAEVPSYAFSSRPFSIFGLSPSSQGLAYLDNDPEARKTSASFFEDADSRAMHPNLASQPYSPLITLMTADYLLTVSDLVGWGPNRFPINYRQLLSKGLCELAHGLYGEDRLCRELHILDRIADHHGLAHFFRNRVKRMRRSRARQPFEGTGINGTSVLLDAATYRIQHVLDAAYTAQALHTAYSEATIPQTLHVLGRSLKYRLKSLRRGGRFPADVLWS